MRYAVYALLVAIGIGGALFGLSMLGSPRTEAQGFLTLIAGAVGLSGIGVVMAIEHASARNVEELRELRKVAVAQVRQQQQVEGAKE